MSVTVSNGGGDPEKLAYFHNPNFQVTPVSSLREVKPMPGTCLRCVFGEDMEHTLDCVKYPSPKCPRCGSSDNSRDEGGTDFCFHCGHCGFIACVDSPEAIQHKRGVRA